MEDDLLGFLVRELQRAKRADDGYKAKTREDAVPLVNAVKVRAAGRQNMVALLNCSCRI